MYAHADLEKAWLPNKPEFKIDDCQYVLTGIFDPILNAKKQHGDLPVQIAKDGKIIVVSSAHYDVQKYWRYYVMPINTSKWDVGNYQFNLQYDGTVFRSEIEYSGKYPTNEKLIECKYERDSTLEVKEFDPKKLDTFLGKELYAKYYPFVKIYYLPYSRDIDSELGVKKSQELNSVLKNVTRDALSLAVKKTEENAKSRYKNLDELSEIIYRIRDNRDKYLQNTEYNITDFTDRLKLLYESMDKELAELQQFKEIQKEQQLKKEQAKNMIKNELNEQTKKQSDRIEKIKKAKELSKQKANAKAKKKLIH